jgi:ligand-binding SRPBCC domain-containing protein
MTVGAPPPVHVAMRVHVLERSHHLPLPVQTVFPFYADARNLEAITPPWLRFRVLTTGTIEMRAGTLIEYRLRLHGLSVRWLTRISEWVPGERFVDVQVRGPYRLWHHSHLFERDGDGTLIRDRVRYRLPFEPLGAAAHLLLVRRELARIFDYRQAAVERILCSRGGID